MRPVGRRTDIVESGQDEPDLIGVGSTREVALQDPRASVQTRSSVRMRTHVDLLRRRLVQPHEPRCEVLACSVVVCSTVEVGEVIHDGRATNLLAEQIDLNSSCQIDVGRGSTMELTLLRKRMMEVRTNHLELQIESKRTNASCIRLMDSASDVVSVRTREAQHVDSPSS